METPDCVALKKPTLRESAGKDSRTAALPLNRGTLCGSTKTFVHDSVGHRRGIQSHFSAKVFVIAWEHVGMLKEAFGDGLVEIRAQDGRADVLICGKLFQVQSAGRRGISFRRAIGPAKAESDEA